MARLTKGQVRMLEAAMENPEGLVIATAHYDLLGVNKCEDQGLMVVQSREMIRCRTFRAGSGWTGGHHWEVIARARITDKGRKALEDAKRATVLERP